MARSIAIGGMALVHFVMVLSANQMDSSVLSWLFERLSGRPAMVFMILAGIGVSLRFRMRKQLASFAAAGFFLPLDF